eukprot:1186546-Prorocentrum_minimum.AAC.3
MPPPPSTTGFAGSGTPTCQNCAFFPPVIGSRRFLVPAAVRGPHDEAAPRLLLAEPGQLHVGVWQPLLRHSKRHSFLTGEFYPQLFADGSDGARSALRPIGPS